MTTTQRARKIARDEGVDGKPGTYWIELVRQHNCNLRAVIQEIEAGATLE